MTNEQVYIYMNIELDIKGFTLVHDSASSYYKEVKRLHHVTHIRSTVV